MPGVPYKVLVDMDGVVADWNTGVMRLFDVPNVWDNPNETDYNAWKREIPGLYDRIANEGGVEFWRYLPKTPEADGLMAFLEEHFGQENIAFCTSPVKTGIEDCVRGKMEWIEHFYPKYKRQVMITPVKHFAAHHRAVLIDDTSDKVYEFQRAGGNAIFMPRPWNTVPSGRFLSAMPHSLHYVLTQLVKFPKQGAK
jgi:5'(3')-deoxyribonucleotidase